MVFGTRNLEYLVQIWRLAGFHVGFWSILQGHVGSDLAWDAPRLLPRFLVHNQVLCKCCRRRQGFSYGGCSTLGSLWVVPFTGSQGGWGVDTRATAIVSARYWDLQFRLSLEASGCYTIP